MINYFIKFDDLSLSTLRLFTYDEGAQNQVKKYNLIDVKEALLPGNNLYIMPVSYTHLTLPTILLV